MQHPLHHAAFINLDLHCRLIVRAARHCPRTEYSMHSGIQWAQVYGAVPGPQTVERLFLKFCQLLDQCPHYIVMPQVNEACVILRMFARPSRLVWHLMEDKLWQHR